MSIIIISTALIAILGIIIGVFLGIFSEIFKVKVNEKVAKIRECLPGNNCGGCGYAGCDQVAEAIASGKVPVNICPVGGANVAKKIGEIMGVATANIVKKVAFVHCNGTCVNVIKNYDYTGVKDCNVAMGLPNVGEKACAFACLGYGNCVKACQFNAISIKDGVAIVDREKCVGCGACIKACPMKIIELIPYEKHYKVACNNKEKGKQVLDACKVSCIACMMCEKNCESKAIKVINNLAVIDYELCIDCGVCASKCPRKAII